MGSASPAVPTSIPSYGARPHPELGPTEPDLDRFELALARRADSREMPLLAICRGSQALNVIRGGTLHQHLPQISTDIAHRQRQPGNKATHEVRIAPDSGLAAVVGCARMDVNSFHHQSMERLGDRLREVAWAQDGVIEGIEGRDESLVLGVQWHAETLVDDPAQLALFRHLVAASEERERKRPIPRRQRSARRAA